METNFVIDNAAELSATREALDTAIVRAACAIDKLAASGTYTSIDEIVETMKSRARLVDIRNRMIDCERLDAIAGIMSIIETKTNPQTIVTSDTRVDTRVNIHALTDACIALGEVKVLAAGSMYATLRCDTKQRIALTKARIWWEYDK